RAPEIQGRFVGKEQAEVAIAHRIRKRREHRPKRLGAWSALREQRAERLDALERVFGPALLRDVEARAHDMGERSGLVEEARVEPGDQSQLAIASHPVVLARRGRLALAQSPESLLDRLDLLDGHQEVVERSALDLFERVPRQDLAGSVEAEDPTFGVEYAHEGSGDIEDAVDEAALVGQLPPRFDCRADVVDGADPPLDRAVGSFE